ncbi:uncharacterized protein LOC121796568 [Salvia splendens]|uniref:uncharacterized protein LOC121796568 n=1 Tax=Salvia splendens TaxID=180675 RepID=UPI001C2534FD|nr:uncharacterized protein LOC121796568 [Salvia splendens]
MFAFGNQILTGIRAILEQEQVPRPIRHQTSVRREHGLAHQRVFEDYLAEEPGGDRRFFADGLGCGENCFSALFTRWRPATSTSSNGKLRPTESVYPRLRSARLRYASWPMAPRKTCSTSIFTSMIQLAGSVEKFCEGVIDAFGATYLRKPNVEDCQFLMRMHDRVHSFPGMLWSIDYDNIIWGTT